MIKLFDLMDNSTSAENDLQTPYTIGNRTIEVINTCEQLVEAMNTIQLAPFIGFDSEQKPTFQKGQADNGICLVQLATKDKCYLIQNKQIKIQQVDFSFFSEKREFLGLYPNNRAIYDCCIHGHNGR